MERRHPYLYGRELGQKTSRQSIIKKIQIVQVMATLQSEYYVSVGGTVESPAEQTHSRAAGQKPNNDQHKQGLCQRSSEESLSGV